jgi:hypothetical protein
VNVSLHVHASELAQLDLAHRRHMSHGRRLVTVGERSDGFSAWVKSPAEARQVAEAWLRLADEIEADDRRASMDPLPAVAS